MGNKRINSEEDQIDSSTNEIEVSRSKKKARLTLQNGFNIKKRKEIGPENPEFINKKKLKVNNFEVVDVDDANLLRPSCDDKNKTKHISSKNVKRKRRIVPNAQKTAPGLSNTPYNEVKEIKEGDEIQPLEQEEIDAFCDDIEDERALKKFDVWIERLDAVLKEIK